MHPSIDHSILSPSGRVSKRSRDAALERAWAELFPPGFWDRPVSQVDKRAHLLRTAANLRDLADRGLQPRKNRKVAAMLEAEAEAP